MERPPGFPATQERPVKTPRRSKRISERKQARYGSAPRAKGGKFKIDFQEREEEIDATLAIELVKESGAQMNEELERMFTEADKAGDRYKGRGQTEEEQMLLTESRLEEPTNFDD